jgi:transcriptional regulator with XRE-family HTH domain
MTEILDRKAVVQWFAEFRSWSTSEGGPATDVAADWEWPVPSSSWQQLAESFEGILRRDRSDRAAGWLRSFLTTQPQWIVIVNDLSKERPTQNWLEPSAFVAYLRSLEGNSDSSVERDTAAASTTGASRVLSREGVAARIAELRRERGVSQRRLAEAIDLDPSAMSRIEAGDRGLAVDELVGIADFLGVTTDDLLRQTVETAPLFRNEGGADEGSQALREFESIIDDFFAFEVATRT